ncbi:interleukin-15 receptor subunit alpha [Candoia aspera]|uniref:interleukin-15 receptor subunit alpha n=1 Tax=Candoia aspera TaxID=51853 RepID=UPI002FD873AE
MTAEVSSDDAGFSAMETEMSTTPWPPAGDGAGVGVPGQPPRRWNSDSHPSRPSASAGDPPPPGRTSRRPPPAVRNPRPAGLKAKGKENAEFRRARRGFFAAAAMLRHATLGVPRDAAAAAATAGLESRPGAPCAAGSPLAPVVGRRRRRRRLLLLVLLAVLLDGAGSSPAAGASDLGTGKCGPPKPVENAHIANESNGKRLRYSCLKNYKRKAGTSNLIVCEQDATTKEFKWSTPQLVCIDPAVESTTEGSTREASRPTESLCANPSIVSAHPYGSQTISPVMETSSVVHTPHRTAKPSSDSPVPAVTATPGGGRFAPGTISENVTLPQRTTPLSQAETSKTQWMQHQTTSAPSEGAPGNTTEPPDTSILQSITDSAYFRIGFPFLAAILSTGFMYYCGWRRRCNFSQQPKVPPVELIPIDPMGPEEGRLPSTSNSQDPGPVNEEDPMLSPHRITSTG